MKTKQAKQPRNFIGFRPTVSELEKLHLISNTYEISVSKVIHIMLNEPDCSLDLMISRFNEPEYDE